EIPYGHIERFANGEEEPGLSWVDVSGSAREKPLRYGVSILNDGKYSFDVNVRDIGITVLRSPIYAHHDPHVPQTDRFYTFQDQGIQRFNYTLYPHAESWEEAQTVRRAAELNARPVALITTFHDGLLAQRGSWVGVDVPNVVVSVVKRAEDSDDFIIRAYETNNTTAHARLDLPVCGRVIEADFGPCEIKTFRVPRDAAQPVAETNLLEL
ncbi:MAG: alpha-mannosidase, partial [Anaerolineae bacterium]|nr:alpha-mannosidase [Anaerolineae bacterium]